ncbi:hypothetical protein HBB16_14275 [Pseudonocardia sp. MCCB 268]|nr:hypothetical protein [Pseudonocardia cytotoxica]
MRAGDSTSGIRDGDEHEGPFRQHHRQLVLAESSGIAISIASSRRSSRASRRGW